MRPEAAGAKFRCEATLERELRARGFRAVAGVDEVGRGLDDDEGVDTGVVAGMGAGAGVGAGVAPALAAYGRRVVTAATPERILRSFPLSSPSLSL